MLRKNRENILIALCYDSRKSNTSWYQNLLYSQLGVSRACKAVIPSWQQKTRTQVVKAIYFLKFLHASVAGGAEALFPLSAAVGSANTGSSGLAGLWVLRQDPSIHEASCLEPMILLGVNENVLNLFKNGKCNPTCIKLVIVAKQWQNIIFDIFSWGKGRTRCLQPMKVTMLGWLWGLVG